MVGIVRGALASTLCRAEAAPLKALDGDHPPVNRERLAVTVAPNSGMAINYVITQGQSHAQTRPWYRRNVSQHWMRLWQVVLQNAGGARLANDFQDKQAFAKFQAALHEVRALPAAEAVQVFSEPNAAGNPLLHEIIEKRQLKYLKEALLTCREHIDVDQQDRGGRTLMTKAIALQENEMVATLLAMGATVPDPLPQGGFALNKGVHALLNVDSGRVLNAAAFRRAAERLLKAEWPAEFFATLREPGAPVTFDHVQRLGTIPRLEKLTLADGCDAVTSNELLATLARVALMNRRGGSRALVALATPEIMPKAQPSSFSELLAAHGITALKDGAWRVAGRTIFIDKPDGGRLAVKLAKSSENAKVPHPLASELAMSERLRDERAALGLTSDLPVPHGFFALSEVPAAIAAAITGQAEKGHHHFALGQDGVPQLAYVYEAPVGYDQYLSDPTVTPAAFRQGMARFIGDFGRCAAVGRFHTAPADFQHDAVGGEGRTYVLSFESWLAHFRFGAGRLVRWQSGVGTPNARVSGFADFKHLKTLDAAANRYCAAKLHAEQEARYSDSEKLLLVEAELLASGLFAAVMILASSWAARVARAQAGDVSIEAIPLEGELHHLFRDFLGGYLGLDAAGADAMVKALAPNFAQMGAQIRFFCGGGYAEHAEARKAGGGLTGALFKRSLAVLPHLSQGVALPDRVQSIDPQIMARLYGTSAETEASAPYMTSSVTWREGTGWTHPDGERNMGPYQGPLPLQGVVSAIFGTVYTALLVGSAPAAGA